MNLKQTAVDLQSLGVRFGNRFRGRKGGAGPSEGQLVIVKKHYLNVPARSWFVAESPYSIAETGGKYILCRDDAELCSVEMPRKPSYYKGITETGIPLEKIALLHGKNCLASTIYQDCIYWNTPAGCKFCGIGISLAQGATILEKTPEDLAETAAAASRSDGVRHVTLTGGTRADEDASIKHTALCIEHIKKRTALPVHVQICPPRRADALERLREAGADTIGIHIESCNNTVLKRFAPCKARLGLHAYRECWRHAVAVFGKNQVSSFIIAGLGQDAEEIIDDASMMAEAGVFPFVLPLRPVPGTMLERMKPPVPDEMMLLYERIVHVLRKNGLSSDASKAGCVRCGACSAISLFEGNCEA